jgi:serine protease Do
MNRALHIIVVGIVSIVCWLQPVWGQDSPSTKPAYDIKATTTPDTIAELRALQQQVKMILREITPAVVGVRIGASQGSGVIISEDGFVLTAGHVSGPPGQNCTLILPDGKQLRGKTLGRNGAIDSGMIKITDPGPFPYVPMGKSADLKPGQWLVAIGHPGGYRRDRPPVVRLGRFLSMSGPFVATDCTLVGGDSGGPLFDLAGRVVGIHSRIGSQLTSNMHVPVDTYHTTWDRLIAGDSWGGMLDNVRVPTP